jgi:hypothetical protein
VADFLNSRLTVYSWYQSLREYGVTVGRLTTLGFRNVQGHHVRRTVAINRPTSLNYRTGLLSLLVRR